MEQNEMTYIEEAVESGLSLIVRPHHDGGFQAQVGSGARSRNALGKSVIEALAALEHYLRLEP